MRIGLFGGSFNPPHAGHLHVSKQVMRRLALDRVWWLVTPGNPLKPREDLAPLAKRLSLARELIDAPDIVPTAIEQKLGTGYTVDTLAALRQRAPDARFVWVMGADNLAQFHRWRAWRKIAAMMPIAVFDRPGFGNTALRSRAALALARDRVDESDAPLLAGLDPPAWLFLHGPRSNLSSSAVRDGKLPPK